MLTASLILNVVILAVLVYLHYDELMAVFKKQREIVRTLNSSPEIPVCPICKTTVLGKVYKSASGHMCCQTCLVTVFGNK